jgi:hypothetical protein
VSLVAHTTPSAATPMPRVAATRQGRLRIQTAQSVARIRRHLAWAEPPGRPTLARTRTATTGRFALVPASRPSGLSPRWARMAWRSAWLSGWTDPLGRSSSKGNRWGVGLAMAASFVARLADGPLRTSAARGLLAGSRRALALGGKVRVAGAVGGLLLGLDPLDGPADPLPVGPLGGVAWLGAKGPVRIRVW